jgi:hypothetical protein
MVKEPNNIQFIASLPPITSAISVSGMGEGARIKLDIPQSELYAIVQLQLLCGQAFNVTIEPIESKKNGR